VPHLWPVLPEVGILAFIVHLSGSRHAHRKRNLTMPNPKRRHSQKRSSTRRAHDALKGHSLSECPNCHEKKMPHRACPKCGYYKGREVLDVEEAS
jgi:large subunit ribosomal protein L32